MCINTFMKEINRLSHSHLSISYKMNINITLRQNIKFSVFYSKWVVVVVTNIMDI